MKIIRRKFQAPNKADEGDKASNQAEKKGGARRAFFGFGLSVCG
jgi:hypothetical protein